MCHYTHFTTEEREKSRVLKAQGLSIRAIAKELGSAPSSAIPILHGSVAQMKILMACFVNSFRKVLHSPTFLMMIYSVLLISSTIVPANVLIF